MHTNGSFTISRQMIEVVSLGDKVLFGGGKYGSFADPLYTKQVKCVQQHFRFLEHLESGHRT